MKKRWGKEYRLFAEAWTLLAVARVILLTVPFKTIASKLKDKEDRKYRLAGDAELKMISDAIIRAGSRSPWRTKCFEKALAGKMMLRRRGIASTIFFGVRKDEQQKMQAHAWIKCADLIITGGRSIDQYTLLANF
jgi:hypothetical protein